ncbi:D-glycero-D-manno-heptose 1,7-bisphosphate phosphatase [Sulfobacillus thermosulfidooxidans DSM 9293]|uniref:D,D-heptose 1,7-bisphosphate phosphatase n=1 Tax=Sulfobacillus thermosulfidooxidans (strain DSM 9293 / VKM B-1269 / AT-1) TaxID=929705 RepID=A0A1W1WNM7_SULTA|nr:HAD family hydrolase [Sulfobacillus thermosulfidooxidans]SMC07924.1 D-glycero-D-manno-heptose 1,7-bisphosphate phosphatase [Sulfobacillus thermosulfidooxidans DSM 9293]
MAVAAFLDRDGVINRLVKRDSTFDSPMTTGEFSLFPWAAPAIRQLNNLGFKVVVVSNQPGVAKNTLTLDKFAEITDLMIRQLLQQGARIDEVRYCLHHPDAVLEQYRMKCRCRKPNPGLLVEAASDMNIDLSRSYLVGDRDVDILAGRSAGCTTVSVGNDERAAELSDMVASDLLEAIQIIERRTQNEDLFR